LSESTAVVFLRTTERRSFVTCRQQWWWSFVDCLEAKETKNALRFGDLTHQALAIRYPPGRKRGPHPAPEFARLYDEQIAAGQYDFNILDDEDSVPARDLGIAMLENYVEHYGDDERYKVIAPEMAFQVVVTDKHGRYMVTYCGELDIVVQDLQTNQIGIIETKTAASIPKRVLPFSEQDGSYWLFAPEWLRKQKVLKAGQDIDFLLYNYLRKALPDERPRNAEGARLNKPSKPALLAACEANGITLAKSSTMDVLTEALEAKGVDVAQLGEVSKVQPPPYFARFPTFRDQIDREALLYRVRAQAWEMAKVRAGKMPVYKNPSAAWPDEHCNACEFRDMCELHEAGSDWEELRDLTMTTWDPYEAHRPQEETN